MGGTKFHTLEMPSKIMGFRTSHVTRILKVAGIRLLFQQTIVIIMEEIRKDGNVKQIYTQTGLP